MTDPTTTPNRKIAPLRSVSGALVDLDDRRLHREVERLRREGRPRAAAEFVVEVAACTLRRTEVDLTLRRYIDGFCPRTVGR